MQINTNKPVSWKKLELLLDKVKHDFHKSNKTGKEHEYKRKTQRNTRSYR